MNKKKYFIVLWVIFICSLFVKLLFVLPTKGPTILNDEVYYKGMADLLSQGEFYNSTQYPLGYPLFISLSFFLKDNFYIGMQVLNILVTSSMIFIVFKLCKLFMNDKDALICTIISLLMPFHYVYPKYIMSENLYFPLFIMAVYYLFKSSQTKKNKDIIILGMLLGVLQLTRHITLSILPILLVLWLLEFDLTEKKIRLKIKWDLLKKVWILLIMYLVVYSPWIFLCLKNGFSLKRATGLSMGNAGKPSSDIANIQAFLKWVLLYFCYIVLMVTPFISKLLMSIELVIKQRFKPIELKFLLLTFLITGGLSFAAVRHSWRAGYNYPTPLYIIGRYILYISVLWLIVSFIVSKYMQVTTENKNKYLLYDILGLILFIFSVVVLIKGLVVNISDYFLILFNSLVAYIYQRSFAVIGIFILVLLGIIILFVNKKFYLKFKNISIVVFYILSILILSQLSDDSGVHSKMISEAYLDNFSQDQEILIYTDVNLPYLQGGLYFWGVELDSIKVQESMNDTDWNKNGLFITNKDLMSSYLKKYTAGTQKFYIYQLPLIKNEAYSMEIKETYPNIILENTGFNIQPNGESAMTLKGSNLLVDSVIYFNDEPFGVVNLNGDGTISTLVPNKYFKVKGELTIQLKVIIDGYILAESNKIVVPVE